MINLTSNTMVKRLSTKEVTSAVQKQVVIERKTHELRQTRSSYAVYRTSLVLNDCISGISNINATVVELMQIASDQPELNNQLANKIGWFGASPSGQKRRLLKLLVRRVLFELWRQDKLVFPLGFGFQSTIGLNDRQERGTEVLRFISSYKAEEDDMRKYGRQIEFRISQHSLAWIYATDWHRFSRINLKDVEVLWGELDKRHQSGEAKTTPPSVNILIQVLLDQQKLKFSAKAFDDLVGRRINSAQEKQGRTRLSTVGSKISYTHGGQRNFGFFSIPEHLEGTDHEFPKYLANRWNKLFDAFIRYRVEIKGFEEVERYRRKLFVFADYIGHYLPQVALDMGCKIPLVKAPKDFKMYPFIDQADQPVFFLTFLDFIKSRTSSPDGFRAYLTPIADFFDWIAYRYGDLESRDIAGPNFRNPVDVSFNTPKTKKRTGTNKIPFSAETLPHLMLWLYAVEKVGMHFINLDRREWGKFQLGRKFNDHIIQCADYDLESEYEVLGETFRIEQLPLVLLTGQREVSAGFNLSALRMVILALEVGLRFQAVQWLDRFSWDQLKSSANTNDTFVKLFVNTDKTKDGPWETMMHRRVQDLLYRQEAELQRLQIDPQKIPYENRTYSRFDPVTPLFVNTRGAIISDSSYDEYWKNCIYAFAGHAFSARLELPPLIKLSQPTGKGSEIKKNPAGLHYCSLKIETRHTPHSARSSFITRRSGAVDYVELSRLVGHDDPIVTAYYDYPEQEKLISALEAGEQATQNPEVARSLSATIKSGPAVLRAKEANSALRRSFSVDRDETIARFKMVSLGAALKDADKTGVEILRNSRSADLVFRDTHVCPVGEECPVDVFDAAGGAMRCGVCKLACKSIDHLPAIAAKMNALRGRIRHNSTLYRSIKKDGNRNEELRGVSNLIHRDAYELAGWEQSEILLRELLTDPDHNEWFLTDQPEIVRDHLQRVVRETDQQQFLATRILDAVAYPALITDELRAKAARLVRHLQVDDSFSGDDPDGDIKAIASAMASRLKAIGLDVADAGELIKSPSLFTARPDFKLIEGESDAST